MKIGVVFPQTEIGADPVAVRDYAQAAESLGYDHLLAFDHVLGANAATWTELTGPYRHTDSFYEPFVLFGYLAAVAPKLELVTGVIILGQRQTALVAKQTATLDVLCSGKLRLGVGIGWNHVEYEALGQNFHDRGVRSEEQIEVLRTLWTEELVTLDKRWHKVSDAGLNPLPVQRPIPIWIGGRVDQTIRRVARLGDGWFPIGRPDGQMRESLETLRVYVEQEGRDLSDIGIESWINIGDRSPEEWAEDAKEWKGMGATHISINTMGGGLSSPAAHIDAIRRFKEAVAGV